MIQFSHSLAGSDSNSLDLSFNFLKKLHCVPFQAANLSQTDDEESDEEVIQEEVLFESPLDEVDPYIQFERVFRGLQQHNPASYTLLTKDLLAEQQDVIMQILSKAGQRTSPFSF